MEIYERVRYLRKNVLGLSQAAFGERLGVSRDVINNIERNRLARPDQKLSLIKLIASEFQVREEWLQTGDEPMEAHRSDAVSPEDELDVILRKYGLPSELKGLFLRVSRLPEESQQLLRDWLCDWILNAADEIRQDQQTADLTVSPVPIPEKPEEVPEDERLPEEEIRRRVAEYEALLRGTERLKRQFEIERQLSGNSSSGFVNPESSGGSASGGSA